MSGQNVGSVRPTQLIYTYGIGSTVDLPQFSAMVMGLDDWPAARMEEIREDRLLRVVRSVLGSQVRQLKAAPLQDEGTLSPFERLSSTVFRSLRSRDGWYARSVVYWHRFAQASIALDMTQTGPSDLVSPTRIARDWQRQPPFQLVFS